MKQLNDVDFMDLEELVYECDDQIQSFSKELMVIADKGRALMPDEVESLAEMLEEFLGETDDLFTEIRAQVIDLLEREGDE